MAAFYHDNTRRRQFAERVGQNGPVSGPERCLIDLLEWSPGDISKQTSLIETDAQALRSRVQPRVQIVFAPLDVAISKTGIGIQALFDHYSIPSDFISQRLESVTHSFHGTYDGSVCCSWFHYLCKSVTVDRASGQVAKIADPRGTVLSQGDWTWVRTSVFMRWSDCQDRDKASVSLVIFSPPPKLRDRCELLWQTDLSVILEDPFSFFVICLDELWLQSQEIVSNVGDVFGVMERAALDSASAAARENDSQHDFVGLHNMAKHIIFLKEGSDAVGLTMTHLQAFHQDLVKQPPQGHNAMPTMRLTSQMLAQKAVQFEVWKLRMTSLEKRMQNIVNLSFNMVTQRDSHTLKNDSKSMRAIAIVTMVFLPLATVATIFGSQFFNFDTGRHQILIAHNFWIFWVLVAPLSLAVSVVYYYLCHFRGPIRDPSPFWRNVKHIMSS